MTADQRRAAIQRAQATAVISERKACRYLGVARSTIQYRSRRPEQVELRARVRELAAERRRKWVSRPRRPVTAPPVRTSAGAWTS